MNRINSTLTILTVFVCLQWVPIAGFAQADGEGIHWMPYEDATELAEQNSKKIMLFMEADWCTFCKKMKKEVFPDPDIQSILNNHFYPVKIDIESKEKINFNGNETTKVELSKDLGIYATPTIIFLDEDQSVIGNSAGYADTEELTRLLEFIYSEAYLETDM